MSDRIATALRVMQIFDGFDGPSCDNVWWRTDGQYAPITMLVNCNDLFAWGCADCEEVTDDNVEELQKAVDDIYKIDRYEVDMAGLLWVARIRGMRPQGAYYKHINAELHGLFNDCGPKREINHANPLGN